MTDQTEDQFEEYEDIPEQNLGQDEQPQTQSQEPSTPTGPLSSGGRQQAPQTSSGPEKGCPYLHFTGKKKGQYCDLISQDGELWCRRHRTSVQFLKSVGQYPEQSQKKRLQRQKPKPVGKAYTNKEMAQDFSNGQAEELMDEMRYSQSLMQEMLTKQDEVFKKAPPTRKKSAKPKPADDEDDGTLDEPVPLKRTKSVAVKKPKKLAPVEEEEEEAPKPKAKAKAAPKEAPKKAVDPVAAALAAFGA